MVSREWATGVLVGWLHLRGHVEAMLLDKVKLTGWNRGWAACRRQCLIVGGE
jgi:hypothetical protein